MIKFLQSAWRQINNSNMANVMIDGVEYAPVKKGDDIRIVVHQRGWVLVGRYALDGDEVTLTDASVIRIWGTKNGLGEIANAGPTANTKLDPQNGVVRFARLTELFTIDCNAGVWNTHLK